MSEPTILTPHKLSLIGEALACLESASLMFDSRTTEEIHELHDLRVEVASLAFTKVSGQDPSPPSPYTIHELHMIGSGLLALAKMLSHDPTAPTAAQYLALAHKTDALVATQASE